MAMAAVRFAARRFTGQQSQAILRSAVANEQAVLNRGGSPAYALRRFTSSEVSATKGHKINTEHPSVSGDSRIRIAHQKKQELFDLLTEIQMNNDFPYIMRMRDRRLLQRLATHVDRRAVNPEWRRYSREYLINSLLRKGATILAFLYMSDCWSSYFDRKKQVEGADSNSKSSGSGAETIVEE
ncbi:uncharacterized protein [Lolium perenne]|uniref:uncharacterized protein n=1 Tax=Lolium perenne TaxID=4522 RepID=UPI0021EA7B7A|nr:uncharacterized protein LOC127298375 [Lolium perenne]